MDVIQSDLPVLRYCVAGVISLLSFGATTSDSLVIYIFLFKIRGDQRRKYLLGIYFAALIISGVYFPLLVLELTFPELVRKHYELCLTTRVVKLFTCISFLLGIATISIWNYMFFAHPLKTGLWVQWSRVTSIWCAITILAAVHTVIGMIISIRISDDGDPSFTCWNFDTDLSRMFMRGTFFGMLLPCLFIAFIFNLRVILLARKWSKRIQTSYKNHSKRSSEQIKRRKGSRHMVILLIGFSLIWMPFFVMFSIFNLCSYCLNPLTVLFVGDISFFLASLAPTIFFMATKKYRRVLLKFLKCRARNEDFSIHSTQSLRRGFSFEMTNTRNKT